MIPNSIPSVDFCPALVSLVVGCGLTKEAAMLDQVVGSELPLPQHGIGCQDRDDSCTPEYHVFKGPGATNDHRCTYE